MKTPAKKRSAESLLITLGQQNDFAVRAGLHDFLVGAGGVSYFACLFGFGIFTRASIKTHFPRRKKQATIDVKGETGCE